MGYGSRKHLSRCKQGPDQLELGAADYNLFQEDFRETQMHTLGSAERNGLKHSHNYSWRNRTTMEYHTTH